ncbi:hypothetical protein I79_009436 [Cricetulus griseus]|uniref:Uncharacterized protein n=1 Tax=Cricetulus griseus TaxID=10029 RepID=G3HFS1_CRIGR|nr:hypothetical protein I79_009436 [Cricetulus griseus]
MRTVKLKLLPAQSSCTQGLLQGAVHTYQAPFCCWTQDSEPPKGRAVLPRRAALGVSRTSLLFYLQVDKVRRVWAVFRPFGQLYLCNAFYNK